MNTKRILSAGLSVMLAVPLFLVSQQAQAAILAAQVKIDGTANATTTSSVLRVTGATLGTLRIAKDPPNKGDITISIGTSGSHTFFDQADGMIFATANEFQYGHRRERNLIEVPGELSAAGTFPGTFDDDPGYSFEAMVLQTTVLDKSSSDSAGAEQNIDLSFIHFPFADGWTAGHVGANGAFLDSNVAGNRTGVTVLTTTDSGGNDIYNLAVAGAHSQTDGQLYAIGGRNNNSGNSVSVASLDDGSWEVRLMNESQQYPTTVTDPWSFVYIPNNANNIVAGGLVEIDADGETYNVSNTSGSGSFTVESVDFGPDGSVIPPGGTPDGTPDDGRFLIKVTGSDSQPRDDSDGFFMAMTNREFLTSSSGVIGADDNFVAYEYDDTLGGFLVESYDLPSGSIQDSGIQFMYFDYDTPLAPVPEPSTLAIILIGGLMLLPVARRRFRS